MFYSSDAFSMESRISNNLHFGNASTCALIQFDTAHVCSSLCVLDCMFSYVPPGIHARADTCQYCAKVDFTDIQPLIIHISSLGSQGASQNL